MAERISTLQANTVASVSFDAGEDDLEVLNLSGDAEVFYRFGVDPADPTVDDLDEDVFVLPATICARVHKRPSNKATVVKLISSGTPKVSVSLT